MDYMTGRAEAEQIRQRKEREALERERAEEANAIYARLVRLSRLVKGLNLNNPLPFLDKIAKRTREEVERLRESRPEVVAAFEREDGGPIFGNNSAEISHAVLASLEARARQNFLAPLLSVKKCGTSSLTFVGHRQGVSGSLERIS